MTVKATDDVIVVKARITGKALMKKVIVAAATAVSCCVVGFVLCVILFLNSHIVKIICEKDSILVTPKSNARLLLGETRRVVRI